MTDVRRFRALRYDPARVDLSRVIVPPYDVIAPADREAFYESDPHSAIRLELTRRVEDERGTDYTEVRRHLDCWREEGVLLRDEAPSLYALRQEFQAPDGSRQVRHGFFALLRLEDYERRVVRPHERTLAGPKADRLKILRATHANLSVVFTLYEDREGVMDGAIASASGGPPLTEARDPTGTRHSLWRIEATDTVESIRSFLAERPVVIADGHHRYETALAFRDEMRAAHPDAGPDAPHEFLLAYFANAYAPGTLLLPIHRLIQKGSMPTDAAWSERLPEWSQEKVAVPSAESIPELLTTHLVPLRDRHAFAADDASGTLRIFTRPRDAGDDLTIRLIHRDVIEGVFRLDEAAVHGGAIDYPKDALRTARDLREGRGVVALYTNALSPDDVFAVTAAGEVLPQKSTFFSPKLPSGLVFRTLEEDA